MGEIAERKTRIKETGGKTPTMEVDDSDLDITLKTPPMVRKVKSRPTSAATPQANSSKLSEVSISKKLMKRKLAMKADAIKDGDAIEEKNTPNKKKMNKFTTKEKPHKGSPAPKKLLTPQVKSGSGTVSKSPKSAKKISKARRRSEPIK